MNTTKTSYCFDWFGSGSVDDGWNDDDNDRGMENGSISILSDQPQVLDTASRNQIIEGKQDKICSANRGCFKKTCCNYYWLCCLCRYGRVLVVVELVLFGN